MTNNLIIKTGVRKGRFNLTYITVVSSPPELYVLHVYYLNQKQYQESKKKIHLNSNNNVVIIK